jgi:protease IV
MSLETETVLDRRNLRRRLGLWRGLAIAAGVIALGAASAALLPQAAGLRGKNHIARVTVEGLITEDRDQLRMLKRLAEDKQAKGVIVFINSSGGTTSGGEALFEALRDVGKAKPVVAQFGTVAASAAYIAGLATDHIVARGNTITGSVGVIFQYPEVSELLAKVGVKVNEIKSGPLKATPSIFQPLDQNGRQITEQMVAESQRWFVGLVADRRKVNTTSIPGLEQGRVYSGRDALGHKLVDAIGGEPEARRWLEEVRSVDKNLEIIDWRPRRTNEWSWFRLATAALGLVTPGGDASELLPAAIRDPRLRTLALDGLVSVWHPGEN